MVYFLITAMFVGLLISISVIIYCRYRIRSLRNKLKIEMVHNSEVGNLLEIFSRNIGRAGIREVRNTDDWLSACAKYAGGLVEAESLALFEIRDNGLYPTGVFGVFPAFVKTDVQDRVNQKYVLERMKKTKIPMGQGIIGRVAQTQQAVLITRADDPELEKIEDKGHNIITLMASPMIFNGNCVGVICAVNNRKKTDEPFDADQFRRLKFISNKIVLLQNITTSYGRLSEQERLKQELDFTRTLQRSLLPKNVPDWGRFKIGAATRPAKIVSGDFYDFIEIDKDRMLVVIGDAVGKGIPACMIMSMTHSFIRANISRFTTLKDLLLDVNENLHRDTVSGQYVTLGICLLNRKESTMEYARAGHTDLLLFSRNHIRVIYPDGAGLGLLPSELADFDTFCIEFTPDMEIMMFTDGINEALNLNDEQFGMKKLKDNFMQSCLANDMPLDTVHRLISEVDDFSEGVDQTDDQTVVVIRHL